MPAPPDAPSRPAPGALIALGVCVCMLALVSGGCGRRGGLEPPNGGARQSGASTAPASPRSLPQGIGIAAGTPAPDSDAVRAGDELPVSATPAGIDSAPVQTNRGARKGYVIPKDPFILDPIL